ncbi:stalk domain-containing protein [Paenibacillus sp. Soil750]|uniref:stalk domain-containing protein n=1 Tax=Paenibacillus sp. Soil750 TaxID=1736398 RepID=UPI000700D0CC|nr:stalk domain-containing protein [Paenibacillus sp. Soil750]KRE59513.1 hypothetical protein ASL11_25085 [Paenibacillus sp. Soil750]
MIRKYKLILSIGIIGLFTMSGSVWAEDQFRNVEVFFQRINVTINGQPTTLTKDSILYEGSVYIPLRSLSEMLGAQVGWDGDNKNVALDFIHDNRNELFTASQKKMYQYVAIRNNQITKDLIPMFKNTVFNDLRSIVDRYAEISKIAKDIDDLTMSQTIDKMKAAIILLQTGWEKKNTDDYMLAWTIYSKNAELLNKDLTTKLSESYHYELIDKTIKK